MATCSLKIYNCKITPDRNAVVDNISTYLASLTPTYVSATFQYQKIDLNIAIKINDVQEGVGEAIGNYVSITQDGKTYYFFIDRANWKATNTVELVLSLDTVNTFRNDFTFNKKTNILRTHKDRIGTENKTKTGTKTFTVNDEDFSWYHDTESPFRPWLGRAFYNVDEVSYLTTATLTTASLSPTPLTSSITVIEGYNIVRLDVSYADGVHPTCDGSITVSYSGNVLRNYRKIDMISEGTTPILFHKPSEDKNIDEFDLDWYLVYRNQNEPDESLVNPVDCFICANEQLTVQDTEQTTVRASDLETGKYYYFTPTNNNENRYTFSAGGHTAVVAQSLVGGVIHKGIVVMRKNGTGIKWCYIDTNAPSYNFNLGSATWWDATDITFTIHLSENLYARITADIYASVLTLSTNVSESAVSYSYANLVSSIDALNRTDSQLIKVIKLPYCPIEMIYDEDTDTWIFDENDYELSSYLQDGAYLTFIKVKNLSTKFENEVFVDSPNAFSDLVIPNIDPKWTDTRNDFYESKLYHSDFYTKKFIYDSFNFNFKLENIDMDSFLTHNLGSDFGFVVNFKPTSTINSKFVFNFPQYELNYSTDDYSNIMTVSRNNEENLYNQSYINYIKTGYNYDQKAKSLALAQGLIGGTTSAAGGVIGALRSKAGLGALAGATIAIQGANNIINTIFTAVSAQNNIEQKMAQSKNQATTVNGSDDVDLMSYYTGNRAKLAVYKVSDKIKADMADLFYYTGYALNATQIPNTTSRCWFNFIQCEPVFNEESTTPYKRYLDDIKARYSLGITVYHAHNGNYDWDQEKENWETNLLNS